MHYDDDTKEEVLNSIRTTSHFLFLETKEEDQFLIALEQHIELKTNLDCEVFNPAIGLIKVKDLVQSWIEGLPKSGSQKDVNAVLATCYEEVLTKPLKIYIFQDPEQVIGPEAKLTVRRVLNLAHLLTNNPKIQKYFIFIGPKASIHSKLQPYFEVIQAKKLDQGGCEKVLSDILKWKGVKSDLKSQTLLQGLQSMSKALRGYTRYEIQMLGFRSLKKHQAFEESIANDYRKNEILKTNVVSFLDTSCTFDEVGGAQRFKMWAEKHRVAWTSEGQAYGLKPPRGVILMGIWGCGKTLAVKALGNAWGLPIVKLDLGRIRDSLIGKTEENLKTAIETIEAVSPCIVLMDEAEKGFSGSEGSGKSDSGLTNRILMTLSTWLQESDAPFCFASTANSIQNLPIEIIRRANERFFFDLPGEEDRIDIIKIHLKKRNQQFDNWNLAQLSEDSDLLIGSEIEQAIEAALIEAFHHKEPQLTEELLSQAFLVKPRIYKTMQSNVQELIDWVGYDAETGDGIRARFASNKRKVK